MENTNIPQEMKDALSAVELPLTKWPSHSACRPERTMAHYPRGNQGQPFEASASEIDEMALVWLPKDVSQLN